MAQRSQDRMEQECFEKIIASVRGSSSIEGMELQEGELELLRKYFTSDMTEEDFNQKVLDGVSE
ncbi:hypothetical protein ACKXGF_14475 (plasmid) [Alkalibacillus sp. S2W]|uniref:hypothetical protein n=1 Tax=Alkalibacillus sp. S2W TaxID=3386553 RepID=UPI00398D4555